MNKKTVCDEQLADKIKELLKQNDVDEAVITEVVATVNGGDDTVDADGEKVEQEDNTLEEEVEQPEEEAKDEEPAIEEEEDEEVETEPEVEDEDNDVEDLDEDGEEEVEGEDLETEVEEEPEGEQVEDEGEEVAEEVAEEPVAEEGDGEVMEDDEAAANPFAKLQDPTFADGFNRGFAFAVGLQKMGKLSDVLGGDAAEEVEEEQEEPAPEPVTPAEEKEEEQQKVLATDSIANLKAEIAKEMEAKFAAKVEASQKVKPLIGTIKDVMAFDSAESIYKFALEQNGTDLSKYPASAYEGMVDMMIEKRNNVDVPVVVNDAKPFAGCSENLSQAIARLKKINSK